MGLVNLYLVCYTQLENDSNNTGLAKKVRWGFSITSYRKSRMNILANPILSHFIPLDCLRI